MAGWKTITRTLGLPYVSGYWGHCMGVGLGLQKCFLQNCDLISELFLK